MQEKVTFYSDGIPLSGILYVPDWRRKDVKHPGIVACHGFTCIKEVILPQVAEILSTAGYVCLIFDYRGFGESGGERGRLICVEQVEDVKNAVTYLQQRPEVDAAKIGLIGYSLGGANAVYAAAVDPRVRCVVEVGGFGDGERVLHRQRREWEWHQFLERLEKDRVKRVLTGESERVGPEEIIMPDPETATWFTEAWKLYPSMITKLPLQTAESAINFKPEMVVGKISPRPILFIHAEKDMLVPTSEVLCLYEQAGEPKKLMLVPCTHFQVYPPSPYFEEIHKAAVEWFKTYLPPPET